ncbi:MAG: TIR domain-containing protein, partial [Zetaproteobacteria bacterium]|nr:TIR domain-containing protein [Zetaproteobacteria bacterium]
MLMNSVQQSSDAVEVFFSYSHLDEDMRDELEKHLSILKRNGVITTWHDRKINAGNEWEGEIDEHMESAHIILLLISSNFMASDYCYDTEMERAIERHDAGEACVIPIILHPLYWKIAPFAKLQALPTDAKAVSTWSNQHEAFANITSGIHAAIKKLNPTSSNRRRKSKIWNIPHRKNPNFTGREDLLARLRESLISNQHAALTQAVHGLGGVGKTQLAVEYAYRHEQDYAFVWWIRAEEAATLAADYAALVGELNLPEKNGTDQPIIIEAVRRYLEQNKDWLLIFDNAGEKAEVLEYLPRTSLGHVIITSRNPNWRGTANPLPVQVMEPSEAVDFLNKRTGQTDKTGAALLAETLDYLPLALEQAGAYIEQSTISYDEYLELFREYQHELLNEGTPSPDYPDTVATTWNISFQQVQEASPEGANLLNLCA